MPLRNRVTPFGDIVAVAARGALMGNRGCLHDSHGRVVRDSQVRRWITCQLEFRGRKRQLLQPNSWTELFFLDEVVALSAGHRPCSECRHADFVRFQTAWRLAYPKLPSSADAMDAVLHVERRVGPWVKRLHTSSLPSLPTGSFVAEDGKAWLVSGHDLLAWSPEGYFERKARRTSPAMVLLTPPSIVGVLHAGYRPSLHASAAGSA